MKVSELSEEFLNYWVAKAEGFDLDDENWFVKPGQTIWRGNFWPTEKWALGGEIIEKNAIHLIAPGKGDRDWFAFIDDDFDLEDGYTHGICGHGPTPLVAAMRVYVASKFGDEVEDMAEIGKQQPK